MGLSRGAVAATPGTGAMKLGVTRCLRLTTGVKMVATTQDRNINVRAAHFKQGVKCQRALLTASVALTASDDPAKGPSSGPLRRR